MGRFTLNATKTISLEHRCNTTSSDDGFGNANGFGGEEVYSDVMIWKVG